LENTYINGIMLIYCDMVKIYTIPNTVDLVCCYGEMNLTLFCIM